MKIVFASYVTVPGFHQPDEWLRRIKGYIGILEKLGAANTVISIEQIDYEGLYSLNGVEYHFMRFNRQRAPPRFPRRQHNYMRKLRPDAVLVHGLHFPLQVIQLRWKLGRRVKIIVQHHAEKPGKGLLRLAQRIAGRYIDAFLFTSTRMGLEWVEAGNIRHAGKIREVMEASSVFYPVDRAAARAATKAAGDPVFLWVGRLDDNKDPLTVVTAFLQFVRHYPGARLYMIYHTEELLAPVQHLLRTDAGHGDAVTLVGRVPHEQLQDWFNSADLIIAGSYYEGSGVAVCEGMSCGCIPVLTDILAFRKLTGNGKCGLLYEPGNKEALLAALLKIPTMDLQQERHKTLEQFRSQLSFEAIAAQIQEVISSV